MTETTTGRHAITVRSIDDRLYEALKAHAKANRLSMEADVRRTLADAVLPAATTLADLAAQLPPVDAVPYVRSTDRPGGSDVW